MSERWRAEPMLYQNAYVWFVFASAMDVMMTWVVLAHGGWEANGVAAAVIRRFGLRGMVAFKFALVVFVVVLCENVGRRSERAGRKLAYAAVGLTCVPVMLALGEVAVQG